MDISFIEMMANAGLVVKSVMLMLLVFSVISWAIVIMKFYAYNRVRRDSLDFLDDFWDSKTLNEAYDAAKDYARSPEAAVFIAGINELRRISSIRSQRGAGGETLETQLATLDNLKRAINKAHSIEYERLGRALPFLATTGSATPFIGLFGTVWGIMDAFQHIGIRGSASLAVVAPGIAEALVATAVGLATAIPAVIFFNYFSNKLADIEVEMNNFTTDFLNLIERDMLSKV